MRAVYVKVRLSNSWDVENVRRGLAKSDQVRSCQVDALVDTGATRSAIPRELADKLGLTIIGQAVGKLADGSSAAVDICGPIGFEIMGREGFEDAYVMGDQILIGQTLLERTDLLVDCKNQRVVGRHPEGPVHRL